MTRYRFATRPLWLLSHLFVLACVVVFVRLGFWQLDRLETRRASNARIVERIEAAPVPIGALVTAGSGAEAVGAAAYRRVVVTGTYQPEDQVLVRNRTNAGAPGFWVVTPLRAGDGVAVAVNRGWVPLPIGEAADPAPFAPPAAEVTVQGIARESQRREGIGVADPAEGRLPTLSRVDVERLAQQLSYPLGPVYVDLAEQQPAQPGPLPQPVPPPDLDEGPHLSYAGQWFIFATLTVVVYPLLLRRVASDRGAEPGTGADPGAGSVTSSETGSEAGSESSSEADAERRAGAGAEPAGERA